MKVLFNEDMKGIMTDPTRDPTTCPPPSPFAPSTDLDPSTAIDVGQGDTADDHQTGLDTLVEPMEYVGSYPSVMAYMRAMLEPEVSPGCGWLLDCLDYPKVQQRWESDGSRLVCEEGQVYRIGGTAQPRGPDPDDGDPYGP